MPVVHGPFNCKVVTRWDTHVAASIHFLDGVHTAASICVICGHDPAWTIQYVQTFASERQNL